MLDERARCQSRSDPFCEDAGRQLPDSGTPTTPCRRAPVSQSLVICVQRASAAERSRRGHPWVRRVFTDPVVSRQNPFGGQLARTPGASSRSFGKSTHQDEPVQKTVQFLWYNCSRVSQNMPPYPVTKGGTLLYSAETTLGTAPQSDPNVDVRNPEHIAPLSSVLRQQLRRADPGHGADPGDVVD